MTEIFIRISAKMTSDELERFKKEVLKIMETVPKIHSGEMICTDSIDVKIIKLKK